MGFYYALEIYNQSSSAVICYNSHENIVWVNVNAGFIPLVVADKRWYTYHN